MILQDIAAEVASNKKAAVLLGNLRNVSAAYTREGSCPSTGVHTSDGAIFIGNYDANRWKSEAVVPYHKEIIEARGKDKQPQSRNEKRRANAVKRSKSKLKKIKSQISKAKVKLASLTSRTKDDDEGGDSDTGSNAGDSFGGKKSMKTKGGN